LHNYRLFCAAGIPMRHGAICTDCLDRRSVGPALRHGCYRDSCAATAPLAAGIALHRMRGTWHKDVDAFIVFSEFQRDKMIATGLPAERIHIKPNFYDGDPAVTPWADRHRDIVFVGRLTREKGVHSLIAAWRHWGADAPRLTLIGDGDDRAALEKAAQGLPVEFLGQRPAPEAIASIAAARLLILPSECFEGFPMVFGEAFAHGTPIAASHLGPLPALLEPVDAGITFPAADPAGLHKAVAALWSDPVRLAAKAANARTAFEAHYTARANLERLHEIYDAARAVFDARRTGADR
jgi:glycosyltransferase involved in cell wall biosynthesis